MPTRRIKLTKRGRQPCSNDNSLLYRPSVDGYDSATDLERESGEPTALVQYLSPSADVVFACLVFRSGLPLLSLKGYEVSILDRQRRIEEKTQV